MSPKERSYSFFRGEVSGQVWVLLHRIIHHRHRHTRYLRSMLPNGLFVQCLPASSNQQNPVLSITFPPGRTARCYRLVSGRVPILPRSDI